MRQALDTMLSFSSLVTMIHLLTFDCGSWLDYFPWIV